MSKEKEYVWIGDDGDNKSVSIERKVYPKDAIIPADLVGPDVLAAWEDKGLVSVDGKHIVKVTVDNAALDAKITELEADNAKLKTALDKAKSGKKADELKKLTEAIIELEQDVAEKDALIKKLEADIEEATAPDEGGGPQ